MRDYCPTCNSEQEIDHITDEVVKVEIKGEEIEVTDDYFRCTVCDEEWSTGTTKDPIEEAYTIYRTRHGIPEPPEGGTFTG